MARDEASTEKVVAQNRRAFHEYEVLETLEAGLVLTGTEVKSLRTGKASLAEAFATIENGEAFVRQLHISPYEQGNRFNPDPVRSRKLLLHKRQIEELRRASEQQGHTLIPLKLYFSKGRAKLLVAVARGKKTWDKRASLAERESKRELERARRGRERDE